MSRIKLTAQYQISYSVIIKNQIKNKLFSRFSKKIVE